MLKRFLFCKFSIGRRRLSAAASNFPFNREELSSRCHERVDTSITSSFKGILDMGSSRKLHVGITSPNHLLEFPRHEVDKVENQKVSSNIGEDDEFAELGPAVLEGMGSGYNLTTEDVVEDLKTFRNCTIEGGDDFAGFCLSKIGGAGSRFNLKASSSTSMPGEDGVADNAESLKTSSTSTAGQDDDFAELGSSVLEAAGSGINLTSEDVVENLKTSGDSTIEEIDDLAALGPSVSKGAGSEFNLTTEKREHVVQLGRRLRYNESQKARKTSKGQHRQSSLSRKPTKDYCHPGKHFDVEGLKLVLQKKTKSGNKAHASDNNASHTQHSHSISITGIPPDISLQELKENLLNYGEIVCASMRAEKGGLARCLFKFKKLKSKRRAVAARWVTLKNYRLQIHSSCLEFLTIRITNISRATFEGFIHLTCRKYGYVSGLVRTEDGAVDVEFKVKDISVSKSILEHLNDVCVDDCRWSAKLLPELDDISTIEVSDPQWQVGSQISSLLDSIRKRNRMQKIYLEDLEYLHDAVSHLKDQPPELHNMLGD